MRSKSIKIYVDTNVLVNYCTGQQADTDALTYIFSKRRRESLFTSSLAIVQAITQLQKGNKKRKAFDRKQVVEMMEKLSAKFSVIDVSKNDIVRGFSFFPPLHRLCNEFVIQTTSQYGKENQIKPGNPIGYHPR